MACVLRFSLGLATLFLGALGVSAAPTPYAKATVVIYNSADPSSAKLAQYYAERREIPVDHLVGLNCPVMEEIDRADYDATIAQPLKKIFVQKGWWTMDGTGRVTSSRISFVALMRGMPLKIRAQVENAPPPAPGQPDPIAKRNEASVDSELACLALGNYPVSGLLGNPYYRRFTPILQANGDVGLLLVCRLDAASDITVRAMIDDAIAAEKTALWGWSYVDGRGKVDGGYAEGEEWMDNLASSMRKEGLPVLLDKAPEILPAGYPVTDAAVYFGWYSDRIGGAFADPAFRFRTGAIAVHIHSFSAASLRDPQSGWCSPLLERGAAATLGNVYEPYLTLTAHLDVFQDRLMSGFTFAESSYMSLRALSWMNVSVGDPLYRPYAAWDDLDAMLANPSDWKRYQRLIQQAQDNVITAAPELKKAAVDRQNSMFLESLASAQVSAGQSQQALATLDLTAPLNPPPAVRFRITLEKVAILRSLNLKKEAGGAILGAVGYTNASQQALLQSIYQQIFPPPPPTPSPSSSPARRP